MTRFTTKGRANPWSVPSPHRCHDRTVYGDLRPMDYPREHVSAWGVVSTVVWVVATIYAASLWVL